VVAVLQGPCVRAWSTYKGATPHLIIRIHLGRNPQNIDEPVVAERHPVWLLAPLSCCRGSRSLLWRGSSSSSPLSPCPPFFAFRARKFVFPPPVFLPSASTSTDPQRERGGRRVSVHRAAFVRTAT